MRPEMVCVGLLCAPGPGVRLTDKYNFRKLGIYTYAHGEPGISRPWRDSDVPIWGSWLWRDLDGRWGGEGMPAAAPWARTPISLTPMGEDRHHVVTTW